MAEELKGNVLVAQSGGPTSVINASLAGVIAEALNHDCIEEIYGSLNGILGVLNENLIDLAEESQQAIRALRHTPGSALGTCRYKLKKGQDYDRIFEVFEAHNIRYFFYIGGNDSQDTVDQVFKQAEERGYALRAIGIPKTIDNDLPNTDHCPGYGSVIKYLSTTIREMALDHDSIGQHDLVSIVEVMGRNTGWIAAGTALAKVSRSESGSAPHLIYLPEVAFSEERFVNDVQRVLAKNRFCMVVVSEGLVNAEGNYITDVSGSKDAFGHAQLGGIGEYLKSYIEENLGVKARACKLGINQRAAAHCSSKIDNDEAFMCAQAAVQAALDGKTGKMVTLVRSSSDPYECQTSLVPVAEVANAVKTVPEEWIGEDGCSINHPFMKYCLPLIQGEVTLPYENGLPKFAELRRIQVQRVLGNYALV